MFIYQPLVRQQQKLGPQAFTLVGSLLLFRPCTGTSTLPKDVEGRLVECTESRPRLINRLVVLDGEIGTRTDSSQVPAVKVHCRPMA